MNERLFMYFSKKVGSVEIEGREYAFCHVPKLDVDGLGGLFAWATCVDMKENFYEFTWLRSSDGVIVKLIGGVQDLPLKNMREIVAYLKLDKMISEIKL